MRQRLVYLALGASGIAAPLAGQRVDSVSQAIVVPGVLHRHLIVAGGPWSVHVVEVDLRQPGLSIRAAHADDQLRGRETVSAMVQRKTSDTARIVVAINADFFNLKTGEDENNQVVEGEIYKGLQVTDAPADTSRRVHSQFGVTGTGRPLIDTLVFRGTVVRFNGTAARLDGINYRAHPFAWVLYTSRAGATVPWDSTVATLDIRLRYLSQRRDTSVYQVVSFPMAGGTAQLGDGPVLSLPVTADSARDVPKPGEMIRIQTNLQPAPLGLRTVVGGWPRLVVHGQSMADGVDRIEGSFPKSLVGRNPRTGVGFSRDSTTLYLIAVDGRQAESAGMSLTEFAALMIRLGVYEGLNLDGGGSTAMVIDGMLVNTPSDTERKTGQHVERTVGNALLVVLSRHD